MAAEATAHTPGQVVTSDHRLKIPEIPARTLDNSRMLNFMRALFQINGAFDGSDTGFEGSIMDGSFFTFNGRDDDFERRYTPTHFVESRGRKPWLVLSADLRRVTRSQFQKRQMFRETTSEGIETLATVGTEKYEVAAIDPGKGLLASRALLRVIGTHQAGRTGRRDSFREPDIEGRLIHSARDATLAVTSPLDRFDAIDVVNRHALELLIDKI